MYYYKRIYNYYIVINEKQINNGCIFCFWNIKNIIIIFDNIRAKEIAIPIKYKCIISQILFWSRILLFRNYKKKKFGIFKIYSLVDITYIQFDPLHNNNSKLAFNAVPYINGLTLIRTYEINYKPFWID